MPKKKISKKTKSQIGKLSRAAGKRFELKARIDLEKKGWVIAKWTNNVDLGKKELVKVKNKFLGPGKPMMLGAGFPDFIGLRNEKNKYEVIGIEVKSNGWLDKQEKEKCVFLLKKKIFGKVLIAKKGKKRGEIEYTKFKLK